MRKLAVLLGLAGAVFVAVLAWRTVDKPDESLDRSSPSIASPDEPGGARRVDGVTREEPSEATRDERARTSGQDESEDSPTLIPARRVGATHAPRGVRIVEVVDVVGQPLSGVQIELLARRLDRDGAIAVAYSDASGRVTLSGDREVEFALRVTGPAGIAQFVRPFRFDVDAVEHVVVTGGATLVGLVEPIPMLDAPGTAATPGLALFDRIGNVYPRIETGPVRLDASGRFSITGIPPGLWNLMFLMEQPATSLRGATRRLLRKDLALRDGERMELVLDLAPFACTPVDLEVRLDGAPLGGTIELDRDFAADGDAELEMEWRHVAVGAGAEASVMLPPGAWVARTRVPSALGEFTVTGTRFVVPAGDAPQRVLVEFLQARRVLFLLDPDGRPLVEVDFASESLDAEPETEVCVTGSTGRATLLGSPGLRRLSIRREPLLDLASLSVWIDARKEHDPDAASHAWLDLGTVELIPGGGEPLTIRLPPEWRALPK